MLKKTNLRRNFYILLYTQILWFGGTIFPFICFCNSSKNPKEELSVLEFNVNDSLLQEEEIIDTILKIGFRPPKNWKNSPETLKKLLIKLEPQSKSKAIKNSFYIFCDTIDTLSPSTFLYYHLPIDSVKEIDTMLKDIEIFYRKQFPDCEIHKAIFVKKPFIVHQIIINIGKMVIVSLLFRDTNNSLFSMKFLLSFENFAEQMKVVESVIGSLHQSLK